jgi:hypothetical protein
MVHKLANGPITLTIAAVDSAEGNFGPQTVFRGTDGTDVYMSEMSAMRGLARLNLTAETAVGETLMMEQVKKDGKTCTNINMTGAGASAAPRAAAPVAAAAPKQTVQDLARVYRECVEAAVATLGVALEGAEIAITAEAIQAAAATLFIKVTR